VGNHGGRFSGPPIPARQRPKALKRPRENPQSCSLRRRFQGMTYLPPDHVRRSSARVRTRPHPSSIRAPDARRPAKTIELGFSARHHQRRLTFFGAEWPRNLAFGGLGQNIPNGLEETGGNGAPAVGAASASSRGDRYRQQTIAIKPVARRELSVVATRELRPLACRRKSNAGARGGRPESPYL